MIHCKTSKVSLFAALASAALASSASAGTVAKEVVSPLVEKAAESAISGDIGVIFVSQYVSRGLVFENQGLIAQPYFDLSLSIYKGEGFVNNVSLALGFWTSLQSQHTDAQPNSTTPAWYEFDFTPGIAVTFAKDWTLTTRYLAYFSPNGGFPTFQGIDFRLDYDDSRWLGAFALHPHVVFLRELENKAGDGKSQGNYYEVGVTPALPTWGPLSVTIPLIAGFGSNQFYADNVGFGYFSAGLNASVALTCIPKAYGSWALTGSATYYYLHGPLATFNAPATRAGSHNEFVYSGGIGLTF